MKNFTYAAVKDYGQAFNESERRGAVFLAGGTNRFVTRDLGTYHVPVNGDVPKIDVTFIDKPDQNFNPVGARGVGEIGITGVATAIANSIYHATGKRVREVPITMDKLI